MPFELVALLFWLLCFFGAVLRGGPLGYWLEHWRKATPTPTQEAPDPPASVVYEVCRLLFGPGNFYSCRGLAELDFERQVEQLLQGGWVPGERMEDDGGLYLAFSRPEGPGVIVLQLRNHSLLRALGPLPLELSGGVEP